VFANSFFATVNPPEPNPLIANIVSQNRERLGSEEAKLR
jgi:hypothetical protein